MKEKKLTLEKSATMIRVDISCNVFKKSKALSSGSMDDFISFSNFLSSRRKSKILENRLVKTKASLSSFFNWIITGRINFADSFNVVIVFVISFPNFNLRGEGEWSSSLAQAFLFEASLTREKEGLRSWGKETNNFMNLKKLFELYEPQEDQI